MAHRPETFSGVNCPDALDAIGDKDLLRRHNAEETSISFVEDISKN
jgi:hypothetical protein